MFELPHFFRIKSKLDLHKKIFENKNHCNVIVLSEVTKILVFDRYRNSDGRSFIIYGDLECLIEKIDGCKNNPQNSFTAKVRDHFPSSYSMSTILSYKNIETKHDVCRGKDCMKRFCECLIEKIDGCKNNLQNTFATKVGEHIPIGC